MALPTAASGGQNPLTASGTATSEGFLTRSADGRYLVVPGYGVAPGTASVNGTSTASVPRVFARVDGGGNVDTSTSTTSFIGTNIRGAASADGGGIWATGGNSGVVYLPFGGSGAGTVVSSSVTNTRAAGIFDGQLYLSSGSGANTFRGVSAVGAGLPTGTGETTTRLPGLNDTDCPSSYGFFLADLTPSEPGVDTLYIADDGNGALTKWSLVSGTWTKNNTIGVSADDYRGLTGSVEGTTVTLYATLAGDTIVSLVDASGYNANMTATPATVATAAANTAIRGIAFAPESEVELLLTEIQSNQASSGQDDYWELTNVGLQPVDLNGWTWDDDSRNPADADAVTILGSTVVAPGESILFARTDAATFRAWWGLDGSVPVVSGGPGLGQNDGVALFDAEGNEVLFFSYGQGGFTLFDGSPSAGGHAGASAGGSATVSAVWDPAFGTAAPRYRAAVVGENGAVASTIDAADIGSPGSSGYSATPPSIELSLSAAPATFLENAANPAATGTVTRSPVASAPLVVTLYSSDTGEATVPATVTILADEASANFDITAIDDAFPDGDQSVLLTAIAPDSAPATFTVTVDDDGDAAENSFLLTEILSNQSAGSPAGAEDYWELTNIGATAKDISGYSWHDNGRSAAAAAGWALPASTTIAPGESVIFTEMDPTAFRAWWGLPPTVQVFQSVGAPGLGQNDGISFFDDAGNELFFFSYAAAGFTREDGSPSTGGHAGPSAGGSEASQALIWVPGSGTASPRYTAADGTPANHGSFAAVAPATDFGSPGTQGVVVPTVDLSDNAAAEGDAATTPLALTVTRSDTSTAFTVDYAVSGGTATPGDDFVLAAGTLDFTAGGPASLDIVLSINGDTLAEPDETVVVTLSNLVSTVGGTVIRTAEGTATILNDDIVAPSLTLNVGGSTIATGGVTTLRVVGSGFPEPTYQWYQGAKGDTSNPVGGATSPTLLTGPLSTTTEFWVRASNAGGDFDSDTIVVDVVAPATSVDLSNYVRVGRYDLPEPTRTALPPGTPAHNLLGQEASGVAYNWDTDTLFVVGDGGRSVTQVSKTGVLVDTMTLALGGSPQGTEFYDIEGIAYLGGGEFVMVEERDRQVVKFTYAAGTTLTRGDVQTVKLGTFVDNTGTEDITFDPITGGFIAIKEISPLGIFQTGIDFAAGTATNGSAATVNSTDLFDPALAGMTDFAGVFALANLPGFAGQPQESHLLLLGQEDGRLVAIDRSGAIGSTLQTVLTPGDSLSVAELQHEGVTMDPAGFIYLVNENGGGSADYPQLWVYAPATAPNAAPTGLSLNNEVSELMENTPTFSRIRLGYLAASDDGLGVNEFSLGGPDAAFFEIEGDTFYLKAGTVLDFETKDSYSVTLAVNDTSLGATPDATYDYTLTVLDQDPEVPPLPALLITEVAPWSSGNSPVGADWFEVTNVSESPVDISGWRMDDSSKSFANSVALNGITTIAPGESVVFVESDDPATTMAAFLANWFGGSPPAGLQIGTYTGSGIGLSTGGDAVWLFDDLAQVHSGVTFGAASSGPVYATFDNTAGLNDTAVTQLSSLGTNGAALAADNPLEVGSPGFAAPGLLRITEVAPWSSGNSPLGEDWFEVTNVGARVVDIRGWKMDDGSESPVAAVPLSGVSSIAPGESVIFIETSDLATKAAEFVALWFGASPPAALQIGAYSGSGVGLSTGGDAVNLFDTTGTRRASVSFGTSPVGAPFGTFVNPDLADVVALTAVSAAGVDGAFAAATNPDEVGSPGAIAFALDAVPAGGKGGSITGGGSFSIGAPATFVATADSGFAFRGWRINGTPSSETGTTLNVPASPGLLVEAVFTYTMQLLHLADGEAGLLASQTAPNLAALVDAFEEDFDNTLIVSGGDNFIPGVFLNAGTDPALNSVAAIGRTNFARPDIAIHNLIGVEASGIGNHEWDLGSNVFTDAIRPDGAWGGALFPHISSNLDYSGDGAASGRFTDVPLDGAATEVPEASTLNSRLVPVAVVTKGGEKIGLVGATTQILRAISSPSGTFAKGFPVGTTGVDDMDLLATHLQPYIDELAAEGVDKIVLLSHLQQIANEQLLATKLSGVDIVLAAGSNTRLGDADDVPVAFPGHAATFAGNYPIATAGADGKPVLVVSTDNEYTYLGRLVVDFDENGELILGDLPGREPVNGAYAATAANAAAAWGVAEVDLAATAFAPGTKGAGVKEIVDAVQGVIDAKDGDVKGYTSVYLEGERNFVRSEETNLGSLTADANAAAYRAAAPDDGVPVVSLKNGGGIRAQIGSIAVGSGAKLPPAANPGAGKAEGGISQLDIENSMRFNNRLMVFDTTPQGLKNILEHAVANGTLQGRFPQVGGVSFAWDPARPAGDRIVSIALVAENGGLQESIYREGFSPWAPATIRFVTLNFLAGNSDSSDGLGSGGDGYPMRANGSNFRYLLADGSLSAPVDPTLNFTAAPALPANPLGEQQAFADFLGVRHATPGEAYALAETPATQDRRIQNLSLRGDEVPFDLTLLLGGDGTGAVGGRTLLPGERQGYRFSLGGTRLVSLSATGSTELSGELLDAAGQVVGSFQGPGEFLVEGILPAGDYLLRVTNDGSGNANVDLAADASVEPFARPDAAVGPNLARLRGVGAFGSAPSQQAVLLSRRLRPVRGVATVANLGNLPDALRVRAARGNAFFRAVYTGGGSNETAALVAGTFETPEITAGDGSTVLGARISPNRRRLSRRVGGRLLVRRSAFAAQFTASSTAATPLSDSARILVRTR